jgi:tRNA (guanine-N7-)-methyltransferase
MFIMATDVADLAEWMVTQASNHGAFEWTAEKADDWRIRPSDWIPTRYEEKGIRLGRKQSYLYFRKKA